MMRRPGTTISKGAKPGSSWILLNETDGIQADPRVYPDMLSAKTGLAVLMGRLTARGTYLTAGGAIIPASEVRIRIVPYEP